MGKVKINYNEMTDNEILQLFKEQYYKIQPNDALEFFEKSNNIPSQYILKTRLNMSYGQAVVSIGVRESIRKRKSKDKLFDEYKNKMDSIINELGYVPSQKEIREKYKTQIYAVVYKLGLTYKEFIKKCGYDYNRYNDEFYTNSYWMEKSESEIFQAYRELCNKLGRTATSKDIINEKNFYTIAFIRRRYKSFNNFKRLIGITYNVDDLTWFSNEKIKKALIELYVKYERRLTTNEISEEHKNGYIPTLTTIQAYFEKRTLNEIWEQIEKEMIKDYINKMNGGIINEQYNIGCKNERI